MTFNGKCPHCGAYNYIKWGFYSRDVVYINYKKRKIKVQRYKCKDCGKTFSDLPRDVLPRRKYSKSAIIQMLTWKYLHGTGLRKIGKTLNGKCTYPPSTIWKYIQWAGPKSKEALKRLGSILPKEIRVITVDELYYKCNGGVAVHIIVSAVCENKNGIYTVIIGSECFTVKLSEEDIKNKQNIKKKIRKMLSKYIEKVLQDVAERYDVTSIEIVLTDDDPIYSTVVSKIFPYATHRICLWHVLKNLFKALKKARINPEIFQKVISTANCLWRVDNQKDAVDIVDRLLTILDGMNKKIIRRLSKIRKRIIENEIGLLKFRTNNSSESTFARIKPMIKQMKSFQSANGMENYLNNLVMWHNTFPFVDGTHKNKSPIELVCPTGAGNKMTPFGYI